MVNDGVVPTLSQLHGRVLHVCAPITSTSSATTRWPAGGQRLAALRRGVHAEAFEATWDAVAAAIAGSRRAARST